MGNIIGRINAAPNPTPANDALILMNSNSRDSAPFERPAVAVASFWKWIAGSIGLSTPSLIQDNAAATGLRGEKEREKDVLSFFPSRAMIYWFCSLEKFGKIFFVRWINKIGSNFQSICSKGWSSNGWNFARGGGLTKNISSWTLFSLSICRNNSLSLSLDIY